MWSVAVGGLWLGAGVGFASSNVLHSPSLCGSGWGGSTPGPSSDVLEGRFDLYLDGEHHQAHPGDVVRMPMGIPHGYYNLTDTAARAIFWVSPARRLRELFDNLHNLGDPAEVVRQSALREVHFLKPEDMAFDPLKLSV